MTQSSYNLSQDQKYYFSTANIITLIHSYIKIYKNKDLYPAKSSFFIIHNPPNHICGTCCNERQDYAASCSLVSVLHILNVHNLRNSFLLHKLQPTLVLRVSRCRS